MTPDTPSEPTPPDSLTPPEPTPEAGTNAAVEAEAVTVPTVSATETEPVVPAVNEGEVSACAFNSESVSAPTPATRSREVPTWAKKALAVAEPLSVAGVFIYLLAKSWMRWPDPFIDFPRDLYIAWRVSVGDALYDRVASWYGPLAHLAEAAGFRIFGVGMDTMVWMNVALAAGILLLFRGIFGVIGNRFSVWLCSMTFLLIFLVGHLVDIGNYNFITPYVAQTTYGLAGLLLMLWALLWHLRSDWGWWLWLAGVGLGVTYLDKPEPLLAAAGALAMYGAVRLVQRCRQTTPGGGWRGAIKLGWTSAAWLAVGFFATWVPVFIYFLAKGGMAYALRATDWVVYTMLADSFRKTVANSQIFSSFFGFDHPLQNFLSHLQAGVMLLLVCGVMVAGARAWASAEKFRLWWWLGSVVTLAAGAAGAWLGWEMSFWTDIGKAFNFSTLILAAGLVGWSGWAAWRDRDDFTRATGLAVVGTAAGLMLARMILFGRIYHYGFFMAPLAVLFVVHLVVVEGAHPAEGRQRSNWLLPVVFAAVALFGSVTIAHFSLLRYAQKTFAVGTGRDRFYTFEPPPAPGVNVAPGDYYSPSGMYLKQMLEEAAKELPKAKSIVAFPETAAINYHLRIPCPVPEVEFHPTGLGFVGPENVLKQLKANPPDAVFFYMRPMIEYGVPFFGYDEGSGKVILDWVAQHYLEIWNYEPHSQFYGNIPLTPTGDAIDLLVPTTPGSQPALPSAEQLMRSLNSN